MSSQILLAKLYLEEEKKMLNFKEVGQSDLQELRKQMANEREQKYMVIKYPLFC